MCSKTEILLALNMGIGTASFNRKHCLTKAQRKKKAEEYSLWCDAQHIVGFKISCSGQEPELGNLLWNAVGHAATAIKGVTAVYTDHLKLICLGLLNAAITPIYI